MSTLESLRETLNEERKELMGKHAAIQLAIALIKRADRIGELEELTEQFILAGMPRATDLNLWQRRAKVMSECLDEVEDDLALLDRHGDNADVADISYRGMLRTVRWLDEFGD